MAKEKKVVLFVVEGDTEETALGGVMESLFSSDRIFFDVVRGDITSQRDGFKKPRDRVRRHVLAHIDRNAGYGWGDLRQIVQISDADGTFVSDDAILPSNSSYVEYTESSILAPCPAGISKRNIEKASAMRELSRVDSLTYRTISVPYRLFFFSRNMEHALHGEDGLLSRNEKIRLANDFRRRYGEDPAGFKELMNSERVRVPGNYVQSWEYLEKGCHSLERGSNLALLLED